MYPDSKNFLSSSSQFAGIDAKILLFFFVFAFCFASFSASFSFSLSSFFIRQGALGTDGFFSFTGSSSLFLVAFGFGFLLVLTPKAFDYFTSSVLSFGYG